MAKGKGDKKLSAADSKLLKQVNLALIDWYDWKFSYWTTS
jgi:hypothetical protein